VIGAELIAVVASMRIGASWRTRLEPAIGSPEQLSGASDIGVVCWIVERPYRHC
jgi:hypothetical protein